jgi:hypothetical protein
MERADRSRWRLRAGALAVIGALWVALWLSRPASTPGPPVVSPSPSGGTAPIGTGAEAFCPGWTFAAFASTKAFVPPNYPGSSSAEPPTRCYSTSAEAAHDGFRPAPTPPGDVVVDGVYLVPTSIELGAVCARAAAKLRYAVPCPTMLPNPGPGEGHPSCGQRLSYPLGPAPGCVTDLHQYAYAFVNGEYRPKPPLDAFVLGQSDFAVPPTWVGPAGLVSATVIVVAAPAGARRDLRTMLCREGRATDTTVVDGRTAQVRECLYPVNGSTQTVLSWTRARTAYYVAISGPEFGATRIVEAIAQRVELVPPT